MSMAEQRKGVWAEDEHERFLAAFECLTSWKDIAGYVGTRSPLQCRTHHQKVAKKAAKAMESGSAQRGAVVAPRVEHRLPRNLGALKLKKPLKPPISPMDSAQPTSPFGVDQEMDLDLADLFDEMETTDATSPDQSALDLSTSGDQGSLAISFFDEVLASADGSDDSPMSTAPDA